MERFTELFGRFADLILQFVRNNQEIALLIIAILLVVFLLRRIPDRATRNFFAAGIRVPKHKISQHRSDLAAIAANVGSQKLHAESQQKMKIHAIKQEKEILLETARISPLLVKEVGHALQEIEREYERQASSIKSEQAREALRLAAEKSINDVVRSVVNANSRLPTFDLDEEAVRK